MSLNRTTSFSYNPDGKLSTLTVSNAVTGDQVTQFVYGTTLTDSGVASSQLLRQKIYPDDTVGTPDRVSYGYNRLGQLTEADDQNGSVHEYEYDKLGRLEHDRVTTLGSGVDDAVLRISRSYEVRGMLEKVSSYDNATVGSGSVVNEVELGYNDFGQLETDYQSHAGAVVTSTTPSVQYGYADGSANTARPVSITYPNARELDYDYGISGGVNDVLSRIAGIKQSGDTLAGYTYLGLGRIVEIDYDEPAAVMTYIQQSGESTGDAGDQYVGLDRFGRVEDLRWLKDDTDLERIEHGYDRASNKLWRQNLVASGGQDEYYTYDGLYQLTDLSRGTLNIGHTAIGGTPLKEEEFSYDLIGNWDEYQVLESGTTTLDQTRTHSEVNEITGIDGSAASVGYDAAGNMTLMPQVAHWSGTNQLTWDAWNRLVRIADGETTVATYAYDGLTRRITKTIGSDTRHFYYSDKWQVLEERVNDSTDAERQFVWGLQNIDDLILRDRFADTTERLYALHDTMHVTAVTDTSGTVLERYGYNAFGNTRVMDADFTDRGGSDYDWETRFCGYRFDEESGLYQVRYRYLHPSLGRWMSRDPIETDYVLIRTSPQNIGGTSLLSSTSANNNIDVNISEKFIVDKENVIVSRQQLLDYWQSYSFIQRRASLPNWATDTDSNLNTFEYAGNRPISLNDPSGLVFGSPDGECIYLCGRLASLSPIFLCFLVDNLCPCPNDCDSNIGIDGNPDPTGRFHIIFLFRVDCGMHSSSGGSSGIV